jgi:predicted metal-dependent peptidase
MTITNKKAFDVLSDAQIKLLLGKDGHTTNKNKARAAFFSRLLFELKFKEVSNIPTVATDGVSLIYNPEFVLKCNMAENIGILCHEVLHCALQHHARRGSRDTLIWNIACDFVVNKICVESGLKLPEGACFAGDFDFPEGLTEEKYYDLLVNGHWQGDGNNSEQDNPEQNSSEQDDSGENNSDGDNSDQNNSSGKNNPLDNLKSKNFGQIADTGTLSDSGSDSKPVNNSESAAKWKTILEQAAKTASKEPGNIPAELQRIVDDIISRQIKWQVVLRKFVRDTVDSKEDYDWSRPNKKYLAQGLYFPTLHSEGLGEIVIAIDTSGSIDKKTLSIMFSECSNLFRQMGEELEKVHILYCDCQIHDVMVWRPGENFTVNSRFGKFKGGGGTSHIPIWEWVSKNVKNPLCVICLTDGYTEYGKKPKFPVLWVLTKKEKKPPFGKVVYIKVD